MSLIQALLILQYFGFSLVKRCLVVFVSYGGSPDKKESIYRLDSLKEITDYFIWRLTSYLILMSSDLVYRFSLFEGVVFTSFWENLGLPLREDFLFFFTTCPEATDPIFLIAVTS